MQGAPDESRSHAGAAGHTREIEITDLFPVSRLQELQDKFANLANVASIITRPDGTPITEPSNFCRLCNDIIRGTECGLANCMHSDAVIGAPNPEGPTIRACLSAGLLDGGASIIVGDRHVANWLVGQVRIEQDNDEDMRAYARSIGADEAEFMQALAEVPAMSSERFALVVDALYAVVSELSAAAYANVRLRENDERLTSVLDSSPFGVHLFELAEDGRLIFIGFNH